MSTDWKIKNGEGVLYAQCRYAEDAAAMAALLGDGATITYRLGPVLWREGSESFSASESYDQCRDAMLERRQKADSESNERRLAKAKRLDAQYGSSNYTAIAKQIAASISKDRT
jgi:hypothetical protein